MNSNSLHQLLGAKSDYLRAIQRQSPSRRCPAGNAVKDSCRCELETARERPQVLDDRRQLDAEQGAVEERANHQGDAAPHRGANLRGKECRVYPEDLHRGERHDGRRDETKDLKEHHDGQDDEPVRDKEHSRVVTLVGQPAGNCRKEHGRAADGQGWSAELGSRQEDLDAAPEFGARA